MADEQLWLPGLDGCMQLAGAVYQSGDRSDGGHSTCACRGPDGAFWYFDDAKPPRRLGDDLSQTLPRHLALLVYWRPGGRADFAGVAHLGPDVSAQSFVDRSAYTDRRGTASSAEVRTPRARGRGGVTRPAPSPANTATPVQPPAEKRLKCESCGTEPPSVGALWTTASPVLSPPWKCAKCGGAPCTVARGAAGAAQDLAGQDLPPFPFGAPCAGSSGPAASVSRVGAVTGEGRSRALRGGAKQSASGTSRGRRRYLSKTPSREGAVSAEG